MRAPARNKSKTTLLTITPIFVEHEEKTVVQVLFAVLFTGTDKQGSKFNKSLKLPFA